MEEKMPGPVTLICERCGKYESHYVFNKFFYRQRTIDFCDACADELRILLARNDKEQEAIIRQFKEQKPT